MTNKPTKPDDANASNTRRISKAEMNDIIKNARGAKKTHVPQQIVSTHDRTEIYDGRDFLIAEIVEYPDGEILYIDRRED